MKKRTRKKISRRYLDGGSISRYVRGMDEAPTGLGGWSCYVILAKGISAAVCTEAYRRGWDGYWGNNPLLVYTDDDLNHVVGWAAGCCRSVVRRTGYTLADRENS